MRLPPIIELMRPWQWVKNLLILLPAFFAANIDDEGLWWRLALGVLSFCFLSSMVYVINDYVDREQDRLHPEKKDRPLASGKVSPTGAFILIGVLFLSAIGFAWLIQEPVFLILMGAYLVNNLFYSFGLKQWVPVDILLIAIGFQLRIFAGGEIADAPISKWLVLMIFLGALMLSMGKRRSDFQTYLQLGKKVPKRLQPYDPAFSSYAIVFLAGIATVAYIMYTISEEVLARIGHEEIYFSNLFMIMGMMRYLQLSLLDGKGGKPSELFVRDPFLIVMVLGWIMTFGVLLYLV